MGLNRTLSNDQTTGLSTVYLVSLSLSLIGSFSVLVVSIANRRHLQGQVNPLVQLALADLLAAVTLMFTSAMNETHTFIPSVLICETLLPLSLMFYFVSFLLVVVYAWESKHAVEGWRERPREEESQCRQRVGVVPVYTCVWFIPLVMYFVYVMTLVLVPSSHHMTAYNGEASTYCNSCILFLHIWSDHCSDIEQIHDIFIRCFLFLSVIPVLVCCTVVYYKVGSWYQRYEEEGLFPVERDARSRKRLRGVFSTARYMMVVIIFCWTPALVLVVLSVIPEIPQDNLFPLYVLQSQCRQRVGVVPVYTCVWFIPLVMYFVYVMTLVLVPSSHHMTAYNGEASTYCNSCILFLHIWSDHCSDIEQIHDIFIRCFLFLSVIPVLVCCTVVYYKVGSWYQRYEEEGLFPVERDARSRKRLRGVFSTARYMMVVIIFCWTPALVLVVLSVIPEIPQDNLFPLYVLQVPPSIPILASLQAVTVSLQGCLNSVVYAWRRPNFRDAVLGERVPLLSQDAPLPFFDESLRGPLGPLTSNR